MVNADNFLKETEEVKYNDIQKEIKGKTKKAGQLLIAAHIKTQQGIEKLNKTITAMGELIDQFKT